MATAKTRPRGGVEPAEKYPWVHSARGGNAARAATPAARQRHRQKLRDVVDHQRQNYGPAKSGANSAWQWAGAGKAFGRSA